ncbi:M14 family metallopeptidase [Paraconexibacter algicola]|uniref:Peptidase M14 domain-containing protein n=1 Tax=Paraconexibacter algicola TaxID=2133960 RepID=A0A2T4UGY6_9ACTN|nr:M14 family metallopeptidase [Paraconexibacter algicola]PTL58526.1 hypothetical protein C7Y72_02070 [Paraconexibacter algicola]
MHPSARRLALSVACAALALPAAAAAHERGATSRSAGTSATAPAAPATTVRVLGTDGPLRTALRSTRAVRRSCVTRPLTGAGVAQHRWIAPADGEAALRLRAARGDWDLAVFESTSGKLVGSSAAFGADEVVTLTLREGASLLVQACRRTAAAPAAASLTTTFTRLDLSGLPRTAPRLSLVDVPLEGRGALARLEATGVDVTHDIDADSAKVLVADDHDRDALRAAGFTLRTVIADVIAASRRDAARGAATLRQAPASALPTGRTGYRVYEDYQAELKQIVEQHPAIARPVRLRGRTFQGRELGVVEIAGNVARRDDGRPTFILNGLHHAREWPAAESIMEFAHDLVRGYGKDPRITKLLDEVRVVVMPITNADGFIVSRASPDPDPDEELGVGTVYSLATGVIVLGGSLSYKRKNCNPGFAVPSFPCELAIGTDPNRNYASSWGGPGASSNPNDQTYRGTGPFSEPETQAVRELTSTVNPTSFLTIHNVAALILRPPGLKADGFAPDEEALKALGQRMADATGYTNQYGFELYDTSGTTDDWTYATTGGFGYTIELGPEDGLFHGNYQRHVIDQYVGTGERAGKGIREAYLLAAEAARNPAYTSRVAGRAPAGRTLRLTKTFDTLTSDVCAIADPLPVSLPLQLGEGADPTACIGATGVRRSPEKLEFTTVVPASGRFEWWVNPSTRPFELKAGRREEYTLTCENGGKVEQSQPLFVARGETARVELPCGGTLPAEGGAASAGATRVRIGRLQSTLRTLNARRRGLVSIGVRGGPVRSVRLALLRATGSRVLGEVRVARLSRTTRVAVRLRRGVRLRPGSYRLRLTARLPKGSPVTVTRGVRLTTPRR